mgnify:CR=1 FL=1|tara:strand:- start:75 stop:239 length:165 start_codon:yes stop_codon:yes gene_type:complete
MQKLDCSNSDTYLGQPLEKNKVVAEKLNGRLAFIGVFALVGTYLSTGQIIPGYL